MARYRLIAKDMNTGRLDYIEANPVATQPDEPNDGAFDTFGAIIAAGFLANVREVDDHGAFYDEVFAMDTETGAQMGQFRRRSGVGDGTSFALNMEGR